MATFDSLWSKASNTVTRVAKRADAKLFGTLRAREFYRTLSPAQRDVMKNAVTHEMGDRAWSDFENAMNAR